MGRRKKRPGRGPPHSNIGDGRGEGEVIEVRVGTRAKERGSCGDREREWRESGESGEREREGERGESAVSGQWANTRGDSSHKHAVNHETRVNGNWQVYCE